jgi:hypothetical protein
VTIFFIARPSAPSSLSAPRALAVSMNRLDSSGSSRLYDFGLGGGLRVMRRTIAAIALLLPLVGCGPNADRQEATCELAALTLYKDVWGEARYNDMTAYVETCMRANGFRKDDKLPRCTTALDSACYE